MITKVRLTTRDLCLSSYDAQFLKHNFLVYSCRVELKSKEIVFNEEIPDYPANQMLRIVFKLLLTRWRPKTRLGQSR